MSINTKNNHLTPYLVKHPGLTSRISFEEILQDFKSLEDLASGVEFDSHKIDQNEDNITLKTEYQRYLQIQDFRRPKMQENQGTGSKFNHLNRSYSMQEMKTIGLELKPFRRGSSQQKFQDKELILSEFIL